MTKKGLIGKIAGVGAVAGLSLLPIKSNAQIQKAVNIATFNGRAANIPNTQDYSQIQKGVNAATYKGETESYVIYHFDFNKDLQRAIKNTKTPHIYLTGDNAGSYIILDAKTSGYTLYYSKKNFNESGEGKSIGLTVKGDEHQSPCDNAGLGSKTNYLASFFWAPSNEKSKIPTEQPAPKEIPKGEPNVNQTIVNNNYNVSETINNYYGDTTKHKPFDLEFRTLIEGSKKINPTNSPFWNATINPQLGKGCFWLGPYATLGFGSQNDSTSTPVYKKILVNQAYQIFTETEGMRSQHSKLKYPVGFGGTLSLNTKNNKVRFDLSYGLVNEAKSTSDVKESGVDRKLQGDNVIEEKPYGPIYPEQGEKCSEWVSTQKIDLAVQPFKKFPVYLAVEGEHIGKIGNISCKKGNVNCNIKLGGNIGWRKR